MIRLTKGTKKHASTKIIISVGRIVPVKGYEYAIKAFHTLKHEYKIKDINYYIIGPIGDIKYYLSLHMLIRKLGLTDIVKFKGPIRDKYELAELILNSDVYLSPSLYETFGISILEAMALGKPIIATDVPGHREIIKPFYTGLLVTPKDYRALAEAIAEVFQNAKLYKILAQNVLKEVKKYDIRTIASLYEMVYNEVASLDTTR